MSSEEQKEFFNTRIGKLKDAACKIMNMASPPSYTSDLHHDQQVLRLYEIGENVLSACCALQKALQDRDAYEAALCMSALEGAVSEVSNIKHNQELSDVYCELFSSH